MESILEMFSTDYLVYIVLYISVCVCVFVNIECCVNI